MLELILTSGLIDWGNMTPHHVEMLITIIVAVIASSGFWAFIQFMISRKDTSSQLLMGIAHDRLMFLSKQYINRGSITTEEYENLITYLYEPYIKRGGNGSVKHMIEDKIKQLPIKND